MGLYSIIKFASICLSWNDFKYVKYPFYIYSDYVVIFPFTAELNERECRHYQPWTGCNPEVNTITRRNHLCYEGAFNPKPKDRCAPYNSTKMWMQSERLISLNRQWANAHSTMCIMKCRITIQPSIWDLIWCGKYIITNVIQYHLLHGGFLFCERRYLVNNLKLDTKGHVSTI